MCDFAGGFSGDGPAPLLGPPVGVVVVLGANSIALKKGPKISGPFMGALFCPIESGMESPYKKGHKTV